MKNSHRDFNRLSRRKTPLPFSLRLTFEERAELEKKAAGMALGAYIRERLLGEDAAPRRTAENSRSRIIKLWGGCWRPSASPASPAI